MPEHEKPPPPGQVLLDEKRRMFEEQERKREAEKPLSNKQQIGFARALLARLEKAPASKGPARMTMDAPPPLANDHIPATADPEPIGGCFSDIAKGDQ